jgi:hypothetical protein
MGAQGTQSKDQLPNKINNSQYCKIMESEKSQNWSLNYS